MQTEAEIMENLTDAGVDAKEASAVLAFIRNGDINGAEKRIGSNRKKLLERLHQCQCYIDRLDYLSYRIKERD